MMCPNRETLMTPTAISVRNIEKTYLTYKKRAGLMGAVSSFLRRETVPVHAIKPISFEIKKGEFVGLLGPNGAGKTTMLKMMTGLIPPSKGSSVAFEQFDTSQRPRAYLRKIGMVMGQRNQLHPDLPALDSFRLSQAIYGIDEAKFQERMQQSLDLFQIHHKINIPVRKLSLGERMKMELILAILHDPELLFLDEPTIGLDFNAARQIRSFLSDANKRFGITIILTSHYTKDIEELCRRVILINHGSVVYDGPLTGLDDRVQGEREIQITATSQDAARKIAHVVQNHPNLALRSKVDSEGLTVLFSTTYAHIGQATADLFRDLPSGLVGDITIRERSLEDIFAEIYQQSTPVEVV